MQELCLIVTNPPHDGTLDLEGGAPLLGLAPDELRTRALGPAPEIWVAEPSQENAALRIQKLGDCGLKVFLVESGALAAVPAPAPVRDFRFLPEGILWVTEEEEMETHYQTNLLAVSREPKPSGERGERSAGHKGLWSGVPAPAHTGRGPSFMHPTAAAAQLAGDHASAPTLDEPAVDLYLFKEHRPFRLTLVHGVTRFQSLGRSIQPAFRSNAAHLLDTLKKRFKLMREDRRLVQIEYRESVVSGVALRRLVGEISPGLESAPLFDLASRLVFLSYWKG